VELDCYLGCQLCIIEQQGKICAYFQVCNASGIYLNLMIFSMHSVTYSLIIMLFSIDFHCHTSVSKDSIISPQQLIRTSIQRNLHRIVVSNHNTITGALAIRSLDPQRIIVGEEVMTSRGEILAAFVSQEIPPGLSPTETINRLRDQGAFISISHPFDTWRRGSWKLEDLQEIAQLVDAIEIFNARCMAPKANELATMFAAQHGLPGTAGSDAHAAYEVGAATLQLPEFATPEELRQVIWKGKVQGRLSPFWVHFASRYARLRKIRAHGQN
jgi:predicted metal-dependent phosphoesterase TrpH